MSVTRLFHRLFLGALSAAVFLLSGCESAPDSITDGNADSDLLQLQLSKGGTRADLAADGSGSFSAGDRVGLLIDNGSTVEYRELAFDGQEWQPRLKRSDFGTGPLRLSAYYPLDAAFSGENPEQYAFAVSEDQSGTGRSASDLLVSQAVLEAGEYRADLGFRHALHRLRIELSGAADDAAVSVRSRSGGVVNLLTGEAAVTDDSFCWITPARLEDGSFEAVIYPQPADPYREGDGTLLKITAGGRDYDFKAPETQSDGSELERFDAGCQLTVRLTLKESEVSPWANRKVWVYGITPPADDAWIQLNEYYTTLYLPWKAEYGWYDCNKLNPSATPGGIADGYMCWAAADSNLLHWWIDRNRKYIDLYGERYKGPDYTFPQPKAQESDIFQCFIDSFRDEAGYADAGINWFIHGVIPSSPLRTYPYNDGGYFKDVFPQGVRLGKNVSGMSKTRFNETIKDALANKKAIAVTVGLVREGHIETIWGAEFDENGDVSYIYMADNNDRGNFESNRVGCGRFKIVYGTLSEGNSTYTGFSNGYVEGEMIKNISSLSIIELGEEYWKQYLELE